MLAHARVPEVQVARDAADRAFLRADLEAIAARDTLARLLDAEGGVQPTTALFVNAQPLPPKARFLAGSDQPQARGADAARSVAAAGVDLARSRYRPQAFAFGEYNLNRDDALPTEPDWIAGVAVRMTLLSNIDRRKTLDAAHERERAAADAAAVVRKSIASDTIRAYDLTETARRTFLSLDSSVAAAEENLRVQELSFREGEATSAAVIDAQAAIASVRTQRIVAGENDEDFHARSPFYLGGGFHRLWPTLRTWNTRAGFRFRALTSPAPGTDRRLGNIEDRSFAPHGGARTFAHIFNNH